MTHAEKNKEIADCNFRQDLLAQRLRELLANARIKSAGAMVFIFMENSTFVVHPVAENVFDINGKRTTPDGEESIDETGITQDQLEFLLQSAHELENPMKKPSDEIDQAPASTGGVTQFNPARAWADPRQKSNRATQQAEREGWTRLGESFQPSVQWLVDYLKEMLPADSVEQDGAKILVKSSLATIEIYPQPSGTFSIKTFVDGEPQSERDNLATGDLLKYVFEISNRIEETRKAIEQRNGHHDVADREQATITPHDLYETLTELAEECGHPTDIIRNRSLMDLRSLLLERNSMPQGNTLLEGLDAHLERQRVRGETTKGGHPVSINESRDASRPYADTTGGKVLRYLPGQGATFVNKSDLPPTLKLNWDCEQGVVLTDENVPTQKPSRYFAGWKDR